MDHKQSTVEQENEWNKIENKWIAYWDNNKTNISDPDSKKQKYFITVAYPYPNSPQHIGHGRTYTIADVHARYNKLKGKNVLFPMGFHYTGSPILGMSRRVKDGDVEIINNFKNIFELSEDTISTFIDPLKIANYFHNEIKLGMKEMGYSIDWRREFTTIDILYKRLISWQFNTLKRLEVIEQGSHPVGWCPLDENPVSQHDTLGDIEPSFTEYSLIKFKLVDEDVYVPIATLRPETIFGVTNLWIKQDAKYIKVLINKKEIWIISETASKKLEFLNYELEKIEDVQGNQLIGKSVEVPLIGCYIPILPASFVTLDNGSGIVMSVPAHAPFDMQALIDLNNDNAEFFENVNVIMAKIIPKVIITSKIDIKVEDNNDKPSSSKSTIIDDKKSTSFDSGRNFIPSSYFLKKHSITDQNDPKLEHATSELYSLEFYSGVMNDNTNQFSGLKVSEAKEQIKNLLLKSNYLTNFYELTNKPVYCRCGTICYVKLLKNQWFLNYGNSKWKILAQECLDEMEIIPQEIRVEFKNTFDWLKERACARKSGLGTQLPWDHDWVIESLSDSVIYMAYYIISKYVNTRNLNEFENLIDDSFFEFIFYNKKEEIFSYISDNDSIITNSQNEIQEGVIIKDKSIIEFLNLSLAIRNEFQYYYPLDSRHSGRDLIPNHLSFFIFNHSLLFSRDKWPKQIVVNGSVLMDGKKMSKSMGNIIPLRRTIRKYSADSIRVAMLSLGELLQDVDFSFNALRGIYSKLQEIYEFSTNFFNTNQSIARQLISLPNTASKLTELSLEEKWLLHRLNESISEITQHLDNLKIRDALNSALYIMDKDFDWYKKRKLSKNETMTDTKSVTVIYSFLVNRLKMLAPFCPFLSEEIWHVIDLENGSIFDSSWPSVIEKFTDPYSSENEQLIQDLLADINKILKVTKNNNPKKLIFYLASTKKKILYNRVLIIMMDLNDKNFGEIMKSLLKDDKLSDAEKQFIKSNTDFIKKIVEDILSLTPHQRKKRLPLNMFNEFYPIKDSISLMSNEYNISSENILIFSEEEKNIFDPKNKAKFSRPFKPALYIE